MTLGRTGLDVARLGLGSSYPAPTESYEEAFERGVNYFYWGSFRSDAMAGAIRRLAPRHRAELVVVVQSYARLGWLVARSTERALRKLGLEHAEVLLLGWYNRPPSARVVEAAMGLRARGLVGHIAVSGHHRPMFAALMDDERLGVFHVRYNAVHRGAEREVFPAFAGREAPARPGLVTYTTTRWGHLCDPRRTPPGERTPTGTDCYRFALSRPEIDVVLAGPSNADEMRQALEALERGPLDPDELAWMRRVGDHVYGRDRTSGLRDGV